MGRWVFEEENGMAGYRCLDCGEWIYASQKVACDCDQTKEKFSERRKPNRQKNRNEDER